MKDTLLAEQHQQYSPTIFCGWDYCTGSEKRFKFKQSSIAMEIKVFLLIKTNFIQKIAIKSSTELSRS
jgi:hypothetical protein